MERPFVFPFECVPKGSRVILYGAGQKGQTYLRQILTTGYCDIVCMADQQAALYTGSSVRVILPEAIGAETYDVIVLAVDSEKACRAIRAMLTAQGIADDIIIEHHEALPAQVLAPMHDAADGRRFWKRMMIFMFGGIGDCIVTKKIVEAFLALDPALRIDFFYTQKKVATCLPFLYQDTPQVERIAQRAPHVYETMKRCYEAAVVFPGTQFTLVDWLKRPSTLAAPLFSALERLEAKAQDEHYDTTAPLGAYIYRAIYQGKNCYEQLAADILPIGAARVAIPSTAEGRAAFDALHLGRYVTVNNGNGAGADYHGVSKAWPNDRYERLAELLHAAYPALEIVQLGGKDAIPLAHADRHVFGASFATVCEILQHARLHIDIEGGLVHLASQLGTKCVVLFGPTQPAFFGYPGNISVTAGSCHACYFLYAGNCNRCARGMAEPECMYSITPERVMEAVRSCLPQEQGTGGNVMKEHLPCISVIIPVYNAEPYLEACLQSVFAQAFPDIEILCVDDGSTDGSRAILERYAAADARIRNFFNEKRQGLSYTRNRAMDAARGAYLYFLDADDMVPPDAFRRIHAAAREDALDGVLYDIQPLFEGGVDPNAFSMRGIHRHPYRGVYRGQDLYVEEHENGELMLASCIACWRRTFVERHHLRFREGILHEDLAFAFQAMMLAERMRVLPIDGYIYRRHPNSITTRETSPADVRGFLATSVDVLHFLFDRAHGIREDCIRLAVAAVRGRLLEQRRMLREHYAGDWDFTEQAALLRILCEQLLMGGNRSVKGYLTKEAKKELERAEDIILYGAGNIGREVLQVLESYGIRNYQLAVTRKPEGAKGLLGMASELRDLQSLRETALVVISVGRPLQPEMMAEARRLGFQWIVVYDELF